MESIKDNPISAASDTERYCPYCGARLKADDIFCSNCGRKICSPFTGTQKRPMSLINLIKKILQFFPFKKKDKIRIFDELFSSGRWNEALQYYEYLKSREKIPQDINERVALIKENLVHFFNLEGKCCLIQKGCYKKKIRTSYFLILSGA